MVRGRSSLSNDFDQIIHSEGVNNFLDQTNFVYLFIIIFILKGKKNCKICPYSYTFNCVGSQ
jgi:hypothetical protein